MLDFMSLVIGFAVGVAFLSWMTYLSDRRSVGSSTNHDKSEPALFTEDDAPLEQTVIEAPIYRAIAWNERPWDIFDCTLAGGQIIYQGPDVEAYRAAVKKYEEDGYYVE